MDRTCTTCDTAFRTPPSRVANGRGKFCSKVCASAFRAGKPKSIRIARKCLVCEVPMMLRPFQVLADKKFCSKSCSTLFYNQRRGIQKRSGTDIEEKVERYLLARRPGATPYQKQVNIAGITVADFVVGKTVIQVDGVYWHTLRNRAEQDRKQDARLRSLGYRVIRISNDELKNASVKEVMVFKEYQFMANDNWSITWQDSGGRCDIAAWRREMLAMKLKSYADASGAPPKAFEIGAS